MEHVRHSLAALALALPLAAQVPTPPEPPQPPRPWSERRSSRGEPWRVEQIAQPLAFNGRLLVKNRTGSIVVEGWEKEEVLLTSDIKDSRQRRVELRVERKGTDLEIEVLYQQPTWNFSFGFVATPTCEMSLKVPRRVMVYLSTRNGSIYAKDLEGFARCEAANGDIRLRNLAGEVWAETSYGDIEVRRLNGRIKGSTTAGLISVEDVAGGVSLRSMAGTVKARNLDGWGEGISLVAHTGNVDVELGKATGEVVAESRTGLLDVKVHGGVVLESDAQRVRVKIPGRAQKIQIESRSGKVRVR